MFVIGNLLKAVAVVLQMLIHVYMLIIVIRAILSWVNPDPYNPIVRVIDNITEPVLYRVRKTIPAVFGGIDLTPIIVLVALEFINIFLVGTLFEIAARMM
jgi:YggT family protein